MTDFETHPAGTADLVKRLRHKTQHRSSEDTCAAYFKRWERLDNPDGPEAANRIEQLVATVEQLDAALTRANAATAAAYEVAASTIEVIVSDAQKEVGSIKLSKVDAAVVEMLNGIAAATRALATPDQTAALDKLIAEAEARVWEKTAEIAHDYTPEKHSGATLASHVTGRSIEAAILAASKKGGV